MSRVLVRFRVEGLKAVIERIDISKRLQRIIIRTIMNY